MKQLIQGAIQGAADALGNDYLSSGQVGDLAMMADTEALSASVGSSGGPSSGEGDIQVASLQTPTATDGMTNLDENPIQTNTQTCVGVGRGLAGNADLVGEQGGIPGQTVQLGSAAVIPQQFGVQSGVDLQNYASQISGTIGNQQFDGVTDVIGGASPIPGTPVRTALQQLNPGQLIIEVPGGTDQGSNAAVSITVPKALGCPTGTQPKTGG